MDRERHAWSSARDWIKTSHFITIPQLIIGFFRVIAQTLASNLTDLLLYVLLGEN